MKIPNKRELEQVALNHSSYIDFKYFIKINKKHTPEPSSFLVNKTKAISDNKKQLTDFTDYYENELLNLKQREMLIDSYNRDLFELEELAKKLILII